MDIDEIMHPGYRQRIGATKEQVIAAFGIVMVIGDTIQQLGSVPNGELWVQVEAAGKGKITFNEYQAVIRKLKECELIEEKSHLLTWIGPGKGVGN